MLWWFAAVFLVILLGFTGPSLLRPFRKCKAPRVVIITGGSGGLGQIICNAIVASFPECYVYGTSRSAKGSPTKSKPGLTMIPLDVTSDTSVKECVQAILARHGFIDALVNNAGSLWNTRTATALAADASKQFELNFMGPLRMSTAVTKPMLEQQHEHGESGRSKIINIGSIGGRVGLPYNGLYSASKAALEKYSDTQAYELLRYGIRVSLIEPGDLKPGMAGTFKADDFDNDPVAVQAEEIMRKGEAEGSDPKQVGISIVDILHTSTPAQRYLVGPDAWLVSLCQRMLPDWIFQNGLMAWYSVPTALVATSKID